MYHVIVVLRIRARCKNVNEVNWQLRSTSLCKKIDSFYKMLSRFKTCNKWLPLMYILKL